MCHLTTCGNYVPKRMRAFSNAIVPDYHKLACASSARCPLQPAPLYMYTYGVLSFQQLLSESCLSCTSQCRDSPSTKQHNSTAEIDGCASHVQAARASTYYVAPSGPPAMPVYAAAAPQYTLPVSKAPQSAEDALADVKVRKTPIANV